MKLRIENKRKKVRTRRQKNILPKHHLFDLFSHSYPNVFVYSSLSYLPRTSTIQIFLRWPVVKFIRHLSLFVVVETLQSYLYAVGSFCPCMQVLCCLSSLYVDGAVYFDMSAKKRPLSSVVCSCLFPFSIYSTLSYAPS